MGVTDCDNMLMLLGLSEKLTKSERDIVTPLVIKGFNGTTVTVIVITVYTGVQSGVLLVQCMYNVHSIITSHSPHTDLCTEAGSTCNGGQTVINPWFIIGGVATGVCLESEYIM